MAELASIVENLILQQQESVQQQQQWMEKMIQQQFQYQAQLQQQHEKQLLQQEKWMERIIATNQTAEIKGQSNVPAFPPFDKIKDRWDTFLCRLNQHFEAHSVVDEDQKRAYFLSWVGTEVFDLLCKLFGDKDVSIQKYTDLVNALSTHYKEKTHVLAARYEFLRTKMKTGQSYADWVAELRGIARDCRYICDKSGCDQPFVDSLIRDAIVLHTPHDQVRTSALQHINPSLEEVLKIAESYEATQRTVQTIKGEGFPLPEVYNVKEKHSRTRSRERENSYGPVKSCPGCGISHTRPECKFRSVICRYCDKTGHIASVCLAKAKVRSTTQSKMSQFSKSPVSQDRKYPKQKRPQFHTAHVETLQVNSDCEKQVVNTTLSCQEKRKIFVPLQIMGHTINFQLDTGSTCSMIGLKGYHLLGSPTCIPTTQKLKAYGNHAVPLKGQLEVTAIYKSKQQNLVLLVADTQDGENLLGLDGFNAFNFTIDDNSEHVNATGGELSIAERNTAVEQLCHRHDKLFQPGLGTCSALKVTLHLKPDATPKFFKPRPIPFSQIEAVKDEIERLTTAKIWKPIKISQWAAPIVVVPKPNGTIRICGDFKVTVNPQIEIDQYPIPRSEELFLKLRNGKHFSKIDLSDAYLQLELDDESKKLMVVNTPQGLFQYERLPFGVASAPAIFQRLIEQLITDLPGCANYLDDIIVTGTSDEEHLKTLEEVFFRLEENGLRCQKAKCEFFKSEVEYLGYVISADGVRPSDSGIEAIRKLPRPENIHQLQSFLGKINYYNKFIQGFSELSAPLNALRKKNALFRWSTEQEAAFQKLKECIIEATQLSHFDPSLPLILATDASSYGIGAVLSHRFPDGSEKPIAYASKTMNEQQRRYSQIEKEGLSIIYGVKKFHQYLYGRSFELVTDHKPLISIFHPDKRLPIMTAQRLQRWAITLMGYDYKIKFKPTAQHANADALSRLPCGPDTTFDSSEESCFQLDMQTEEMCTTFPINWKTVQQAMPKDKILSKVYNYVVNGWPKELPSGEESLQPYFSRQSEFTTFKGVLLLQTDYQRVVIPLSLRNQVLSLLHQGHWGIVRTKQLARRHCWWPRMDSAIESLVRQCEPCQQVRASPSREFQNWPEAPEPWHRLHLDFAGPFWNSRWLICVDAFSRFPYVIEMRSTTTEATIDALRRIFVIEGLPAMLVSDNGTQFTSRQFQDFCSTNGIDHRLTAPFHPASNGRAERSIRTFKEAMRKACWGGDSKKEALQTLLTTYRTSPDPVSGKSPAELLHGRQPRTLLSLLQPPDVLTRKSEKRGHAFPLQTQVYVKNFSKGSPWIPGKVVEFVGNMMYLVDTPYGIIRRHKNQIRRRGILKLDHTEQSSSDEQMCARIGQSQRVPRPCPSLPRQVSRRKFVVRFK